MLTAVDRVTGFRRAVVSEAGLPEPRVLHGSFSIEGGREMALAAMSGTPRPTALFATNNFIAIGVLHALDELGISVPDDVAVVGLDDLPEAMVTFPFLTVAAQPAFELGRESIAMLLDRLADPGRPTREVILPTDPGDPAVERRPAGLTAPRAPCRTSPAHAAWVHSTCDPHEQSFILIRSALRARRRQGDSRESGKGQGTSRDVRAVRDRGRSGAQVSG